MFLRVKYIYSKNKENTFKFYSHQIKTVNIFGIGKEDLALSFIFSLIDIKIWLLSLKLVAYYDHSDAGNVLVSDLFKKK